MVRGLVGHRMCNSSPRKVRLNKASNPSNPSRASNLSRVSSLNRPSSLNSISSPNSSYKISNRRRSRSSKARARPPLPVRGNGVPRGSSMTRS